MTPPRCGARSAPAFRRSRALGVIARLCVPAALLSAVLAAAAAAETVVEFTPGRAPCDGVCTLEWVRTQIAIPEGELTAQTVYPGDVAVWMSYGRDGRPRASQKTYVVATDHPLTGVGFTFVRGGRDYLLMRIDECRNWALFLGAGRQAEAAAAPLYPVGPAVGPALRRGSTTPISSQIVRRSPGGVPVGAPGGVPGGVPGGAAPPRGVDGPGGAFPPRGVDAIPFPAGFAPPPDLSPPESASPPGALPPAASAGPPPMASVSAVPIPAPLTLLLAAIGGVLLIGRRS